MKTKLLALGVLFASLCASVQGQTLTNKTPVLHLSFDSINGSTVINDGTGGSGMNGTLNGTATIVPGGKFGNCLSISGSASTDASCRIANAVVPLNASSAWTVAMWVKTTTAGGCYAYQGDGGWASGNSTFYLNGGSGAGTKAGGVRNSQNWVAGTTDVNDGLWHHLVVTCDGSIRTVYLDGNLENTDTDWAGSGNGSQFYIGGSGTGEGDGQVNLNGLIDEAYVFNQVLSQTDIQQLYSNNTLPIVPVAVTVSPASGYRGQTFTVTATVTPGAGTVTNITANLSALGLASATNLVLSSTANVFTNSFTAPTNAPVGADNVLVTAITTTSPYIGSGGATFTVVPRPPTNAIVSTQLVNITNYQYTEVSFLFATTNDAPKDAPFPMAYAWYKNNVLVSTNAMGPYYTFLSTPDDNGAQIYAIAHVADTNYSSIAVTSAVVTLTLTPGTPVYTNGLKQEYFAGGTRANVEIGNIGSGVISFVTTADSAGGFGDNHVRRYSGYFIPPVDDNYAFFVSSDDDCDVFLSTDSTPANKQLIAQEAGWSGTRSWLSAGGGGSIIGQKRSDQWTNSINVAPYSTGIHLLAGQKYYIESVMHNGSGGDNWAITYQTMSEIADPNWSVNFTNGAPTRMTAASNNIAFISFPGSTLTWLSQPKASATVYEGNTTNFTCKATSDAEMAVKYQWYVNNQPYAGATGTNLSLTSIPASYNGAQIYCVANTQLGGLSITSSVSTLTVNQAVFEVGFLKAERWASQTSLTALENGSLGTPNYVMAVPGFGVSVDNPSLSSDFVRRVSGYFVPATTGDYKFYTTGDDDTDLFLSTDNTAGNKRIICHSALWNTTAPWGWLSIPTWDGSYAFDVKQTRSSTWSPDNGVTTPYAAGIHLNAGQRYYIEQDFHQGGGGANNAATFAFIADPDPAAGTATRFTGSLIGMSAVRCTYVNITNQPVNATNRPMGYVTFSADGQTDSQTPIGAVTGSESNYTNNFLFYQWYKNGVPITNANSKILTLGPLMPSDNGAQIYCKMRALGYADNSLNPIWAQSASASITVTPQFVFEPGVALIDWWTNSTRANIEVGAAGLPQYSYTTPKFEGPTANTGMRGYATRTSGFFIPPTTGQYTFFVNSDGASDLFLSTDDKPANMRVIAKETAWSNPFQWTAVGSGSATTKRSDQFVDASGSAPYPSGISLIGGQKYYMEADHVAGGGNDHIEVTYIVNGDSAPALNSDSMLTGNVMGIYAPRTPWVAFLQQPANQTVLSGGNSVTFSVKGTNPPSLWVGTTGNPSSMFTNPVTASLQYQWYKSNVAIPGATAATYTQPYVLPSDNNAQFYCQIRALGYADDSLNRIWSNSVPAVLSVTTDTNLPVLTYAATLVNSNQDPVLIVVNVTFNKWMDPTTLSNAANYSIAGASITGVSVASNHRTVALTLDQMPTLPVVVTVHGVKDLSGNTIAANSTTPINAETLTFKDIGNLGVNGLFGTTGIDPAYPSFISITGNGSYIVSAEGSDIWNNADGFNFGWELKTNDFDMVVRQVSNGHTSQYAKGGLMVREDLGAGSRNWSMINNPSSADGIMAPDNSGYGQNIVEGNARLTAGTNTVAWDTLVSRTNNAAYPNAWLRIKRTGNTLNGFLSTNGVDWLQTGRYDTSTNVNGALPSVVYVGLCTTAHNNDVDQNGGIVPATTPPSPYKYYNTVEYANYTSSFVLTVRAQLSVGLSGGNVIVSWTPSGGHLESSPALSGPSVNWQTVGSNNPATIPIGSGAQFFRVVTP